MKGSGVVQKRMEEEYGSIRPGDNYNTMLSRNDMDKLLAGDYEE